MLLSLRLLYAGKAFGGIWSLLGAKLSKLSWIMFIAGGEGGAFVLLRGVVVGVPRWSVLLCAGDASGVDIDGIVRGVASYHKGTAILVERLL